jgi:hypothetical protein
MDLQAEGYLGQKLFSTSSLINSMLCDNLTIDTLTLGRTAGTAIYTGGVCTNMLLRNSDIYNCGGCGAAIYNGTPSVISNNFIHSIGNICYQSPGVALSCAGTINVTCNNIFDCKMGAVVGPNLIGASITSNSISNCMQVLRDFGAIDIYQSTNNVIAGNCIQHIGGYANDGTDGRDWYRHAIYCDERTDGCHIYNNITFDVARPLMLNMCYNHIITNNCFIDTSDIIRLQFMNTLKGNIAFERNICYSKTNIYVQFRQGWLDVDNWNAVIDWRTNVFYSAISGATGVMGMPTNAITLDPKFISLSPLNVSFQAISPAPALGILPLDTQRVGAGVHSVLYPAGDLRIVPR